MVMNRNGGTGGTKNKMKLPKNVKFHLNYLRCLELSWRCCLAFLLCIIFTIPLIGIFTAHILLKLSNEAD